MITVDNVDKTVDKIERCPYCGQPVRNIEVIPEIDRGEVVCVVGNKREIAALMNKGEFEDFCRIWHKVQDDLT